MGTSAASEPLNFFIVEVYDRDNAHIDKICDYVSQKSKNLRKTIGCEAQEGAV